MDTDAVSWSIALFAVTSFFAFGFVALCTIGMPNTRIIGALVIGVPLFSASLVTGVVNYYATVTSDYYIVEYSNEIECNFYDLIEETPGVRNHLIIRYSVEHKDLWKVSLKTRVHDFDIADKAVEGMSFPVFKSKHDALEYQCSQKGEGYELTFDNKCLRCE